MSSSLDHKCQRCGSQFHGQICPFCTITGLDVNALLAAEGLSATPPQSAAPPPPTEQGQSVLVDVVSNRVYPVVPPSCRYGRDVSNDIVLTGDKSLSRFHFQLTLKDNEYYVDDAGSRNGTFLNGSPCNGPRKILNGDVISAGMSRYRFVVGGEDAAHSSGNGEAKSELAAQAATPSPAPAEAAAPSAPPLPKKEPARASAAIKETAKETPKQSAQPTPPPTPAATPPEKELAKAAASQAPPQKTEPPADPLKRLYEEGQALLGKTGDGDEASVDKLIPGKEDELGDTASRFLKLANPLDALFQSGSGKAEEGSAALTGSTAKAAPTREWPKWCQDFSFPELDALQSKAKEIVEQIAEQQKQLDKLQLEVQDVQNLKNRLLATRDAEMVEACSAVFQKLGFSTRANADSPIELILSADDKAMAIARIVCTETQPKPNELSNLVSSLSAYWSEHGVEPKGILLVAFVLDGPPGNRPELTKEYADYAAKKNVCLMNSLQMLSIFRETALKNKDVESIKSELLGANGQLTGFELT